VAHWKAESTQELEEISSLVHDAYFDIDAVEYDEAAGALLVPFAQAGPEDGRARSGDERVPFMRGRLVVSDVEAVDLDRAPGDAAMLVYVRYDAAGGVVTVEGVSGDLVVRVSRLHVTAEVHPEQIALYVRRRHGPMGTSEVPYWPGV